jgi:hypothetical protein
MRTDSALPGPLSVLPAHRSRPAGRDPKEPMRHTLPSDCSTVARCLLAPTLLLLSSTTAWAEADPYVVGAAETISHDSNVVRLPDGAVKPPKLYATTDWIATTALFAGIDQPFGRQRGYGNVSLRNNHYRYNQDYDNLGYGLAGGLDWSTADRVSGTVSLSSNRSLANFDKSNGNNAPDIVKNIEQTNQFAASARVGVVTDLTFEGGYKHQSQHFSQVGAKLKQDIINFGARYRMADQLTLGGGLRFTHGRYPDDNDSFKGRNLDLSADWSPSPISGLSARLSLGKTDHSLATAQDYSGATGALTWNWKPTAKLAFNTQLSRATGNESSFSTGGNPNAPVTAQADNSRLTSSAGLNASYEATAKILLNAAYSVATRKLTNALALNAGQPTTDTDADRTTRSQLGVRYLPTRTLEFACNIGRDARVADASKLTYTYSANTVACSAQLSVQL